FHGGDRRRKNRAKVQPREKIRRRIIPTANARSAALRSGVGTFGRRLAPPNLKQYSRESKPLNVSGRIVPRLQVSSTWPRSGTSFVRLGLSSDNRPAMKPESLYETKKSQKLERLFWDAIYAVQRSASTAKLRICAAPSAADKTMKPTSRPRYSLASIG